MDGSTEDLRFFSDSCTFTFPHDRNYVYLEDGHGATIAQLFVLSGVQPIYGRDDTSEVGSWQVDERSGETIFSLRASSSAWSGKTFRFMCMPHRFSYDVTVEGEGCLAEALIDTDNWPVRDKAAWREYLWLQPSIGVPSLYFISLIDVTQELLDDDDYQLIRRTWKCATSG